MSKVKLVTLEALIQKKTLNDVDKNTLVNGCKDLLESKQWSRLNNILSLEPQFATDFILQIKDIDYASLSELIYANQLNHNEKLRQYFSRLFGEYGPKKLEGSIDKIGAKRLKVHDYLALLTDEALSDYLAANLPRYQKENVLYFNQIIRAILLAVVERQKLNPTFQFSDMDALIMQLAIKINQQGFERGEDERTFQLMTVQDFKQLLRQLEEDKLAKVFSVLDHIKQRAWLKFSKSVPDNLQWCAQDMNSFFKQSQLTLSDIEPSAHLARNLLTLCGEDFKLKNHVLLRIISCVVYHTPCLQSQGLFGIFDTRGIQGIKAVLNKKISSQERLKEILAICSRQKNKNENIQVAYDNFKALIKQHACFVSDSNIQRMAIN